MAALTDNKYDVYNWIMEVIDSCETYFHFNRVQNLISNFYDRYGDHKLAGSLRAYAHNQEYK